MNDVPDEPLQYIGRGMDLVSSLKWKTVKSNLKKSPADTALCRKGLADHQSYQALAQAAKIFLSRTAE
jgi:hypothetical protein